MSTKAPTAAPSTIFAALGDENRLRILTVLSRYPAGASATTLADGMPVTRQAVSRHLNVLHNAGLVDNQRHGREARYAVRTQ
ncbi:MAG: metalloregulator ArsR/SmtB family transcription factor [Ornithinimicrobium sp.]